MRRRICIAIWVTADKLSDFRVVRKQVFHRYSAEGVRSQLLIWVAKCTVVFQIQRRMRMLSPDDVRPAKMAPCVEATYMSNVETRPRGPVPDGSFPALILHIPDLHINKRRFTVLPFVNLLEAPIDGDLVIIGRSSRLNDLSIPAATDELDWKRAFRHGVILDALQRASIQS